MVDQFGVCSQLPRQALVMSKSSLLRVIQLFVLLLITTCSLFQNDTKDESQSLILIQEINLGMEEPSGLSIDPIGGFLYCVNDPPNNKVYKLDMEGEIISVFPFRGRDLEGVCFDPRDNSIWVAEEGDKRIIHLAEQGYEISHSDIDLTIDNSNSGLEGLCFEPTTNSFFSVTEKNPASFVHLDSMLRVVSQDELNFATDFSGIATGRKNGEFLILSHEDKHLYEWSMSQGLQASYKFDVKQAEGIAFDPLNKLIYIVCDAESKLYVFEFPVNES